MIKEKDYLEARVTILKYEAQQLKSPLENLVIFNSKNMSKLINQLYDELKHGDNEHQEWLKNKIESFFTERKLI